MSLTKARKREIRHAVRDAVACEVLNMDPKNFEGIAEDEAEQAYVLKERAEIAARINYKKEEPAGDEY